MKQTPYSILRVLVSGMFIALSAHAAPPAAQSNAFALREASTVVSKEIDEAMTENAKYSGGLIKAQIESRIETLKLTKAIIDQRIKAIDTGAKITIEVPGSKPDLEQAAALDKEIDALDQRIASMQQKADQYSGGLILAQLQSSIATMEQTRAMLQQRAHSARYGLGSPRAPAASSLAAATKQSHIATTPKAKAAPPENEQIITVALTGKRNVKPKYQEFIYFDATFTAVNLQKPARAIKGALQITDLFGEKIVGIGWALESPMNPGDVYTTTGEGFQFNQFMNEHRRVRDTDLENLRATFRVDSILYQDGTRQDF